VRPNQAAGSNQQETPRSGDWPRSSTAARVHSTRSPARVRPPTPVSATAGSASSAASIVLSFGSGLRGQRFAPATTPSADSRRSFQTLRSARSHCWQTVGPPGIRLRASLQATPNLPRQFPHKFWASESIAPLPNWSRPSIRFLFIVSVVLPPASIPRRFTPQLPLTRGSACSAHRGLEPHTP